MPGSKSEHRLFYMSGPGKPVLSKNVLDEICQAFILRPNPYMNQVVCFASKAFAGLEKWLNR